MWGRERGDAVLWADLERGDGGLILPLPVEDMDARLARWGQRDLTGDAVADLAVLVDGYDEPGENSGMVIVVSGAEIGAL